MNEIWPFIYSVRALCLYRVLSHVSFLVLCTLYSRQPVPLRTDRPREACVVPAPYSVFPSLLRTRYRWYSYSLLFSSVKYRYSC